MTGIESLTLLKTVQNTIHLSKLQSISIIL